MRFLKTKQKLTLLFTLYFFFFLFALAVVFIGTFQFIYMHSLRQDLTHEFKEVVTDHVGIDKTGIFFKKDKNGDTLRLHLFNDGVSALFIGSDGATIRKYGVFESQVQPAGEVKDITQKIKKSEAVSKVTEATLSWNGTKYIAFITPLKFQDQTIGSMVLAKSLKEVESVTQNAAGVLAMLGFLGLGGSFFMGYFFTRSSLNPIQRIMRSIEQTTLNKLEKKAHVEGHPDDEFVQLAEKFNKMLERLDDMSKRQREFVANASHELKTPLTRAVSSLDVLMATGQITKEELILVRGDLMQISDLIERLLILGKMKEGNLPKGQTPISEVLEKMKSLYGKEFEDREMIIKKSSEGDFFIPIAKDYAEIIFSNLLSNAIKFSAVNSPITVEINNQNKTVSVIDQGVGLSKEEKERIFDRFYRGDKTRHVTPGYGLGLNLVKQICDEYGIRITIVSEKGVGTTFTLHFAA